VIYAKSPDSPATNKKNDALISALNSNKPFLNAKKNQSSDQGQIAVAVPSKLTAPKPVIHAKSSGSPETNRQNEVISELNTNKLFQKARKNHSSE
jgi:hypothetical protein